jgi:bis(5'-adenosyl)-triphosphatase
MRVVPRLADLSPAEITDLFLSVQRIGKVIEKEYGGQGLTMSCQVSVSTRALQCHRGLLG